MSESSTAIRTIAVIEGCKGLLVLIAGCGIFLLIHQDLHSAAVELVRNLHLDPVDHYPHLFLDLAARVTNKELWLAAGGALLYALIRFAEAYGLWRERVWAEWFGVISSGIYLPFELYEVFTNFRWGTIVILAVNLCVIWFLARALRNRSLLELE